MPRSTAEVQLSKQLRELSRDSDMSFSAGLLSEANLFEWRIMFCGPPGTDYEDGLFEAHLTFPQDYPMNPPKMKFVSKMWHPNVFPTGEVCISILHEPGADPYEYDRPEERWQPVHTVRSIIVSVISMLQDPNIDSPANEECARQYRDDRDAYRRQVRKTVRQSQR